MGLCLNFDPTLIFGWYGPSPYPSQQFSYEMEHAKYTILYWPLESTHALASSILILCKYWPLERTQVRIEVSLRNFYENKSNGTMYLSNYQFLAMLFGIYWFYIDIWMINLDEQEVDPHRVMRHLDQLLRCDPQFYWLSYCMMMPRPTFLKFKFYNQMISNGDVIYRPHVSHLDHCEFYSRKLLISRFRFT